MTTVRHRSRVGAQATHMGHGPAHEVLATLFFGGRRRVYRELTACRGVRAGYQVLDVGCGDGYLVRILADAVGTTPATLGVDPSHEAIARARQITPAANCTFSNGVAERLDATDNSFDVLVSAHMVHHLAEAVRGTAIEEMWFRVLRPGGRILLAEFRPLKSSIARSDPSIASAAMQHNPLHLLEPTVESAGFRSIRSGDLRRWIRYVQADKPHMAIAHPAARHRRPRRLLGSVVRPSHKATAGSRTLLMGFS